MTFTPDPRRPLQGSSAVDDQLARLARLSSSRIAHRITSGAAMGGRMGKGSLGLGFLVVIGVALLAATHLFGTAPASAVLTKPAKPSAVAATAGVSVAATPPAPTPATAAPSGGGSNGEARGLSAPLAVPTELAESPEGRLVTVYRAIAEHRMTEALALAETLVRDLPHFRLAQLVYGDLLLMRQGQLQAFGGTINRSSDPLATAELDLMREEAQRRIAALRERPPTDRLPAQFVVLPERIRHAIAVDVSRSRLYLFENTPQGVRLVRDFYASIGKQGADKLVEGDQRTPLGVYFIYESIDPKTLEDRFGSAALALNYPNANDRAAGRTGSGILVHGVPSSTYARAPRATDGCVALANDDLASLSKTITARETPVVIAQQIEWVAPEKTRNGHAAFLDVLRDWQEARLRDDQAALSAYYAEGEAGGDKVLATPTSVRGGAKPSVATAPAPAGFDDITVLSWHDKRPLMVVSYRERGADGSRGKRAIRQYWTLEGGRWKIFSQGSNA